MRKLFFISLAIVSTFTSFAQMTKKEKKDERKQRINALIKQEEEGVIAYHKHTAFGFKLTNDGYGGFFEVGRAKSIKKVTLFQLDITERKHPKEDKQTNISLPTSPFIFGKINYMYPVKIGVQQQIVFGNKTNRNGISVTGNFGGGLSLAILRPYNLEVNDLDKGSRKLVRYESNDSTLYSSTGTQKSYVPDSVLFTNGSLLSFLQVSGSGLGKGWNQLKVTPGLYAKAALRFDYGQYNEMLNAIEVGIAGEFYSKKIPQMVYSKPSQYFTSIYVSLVFGRRK
jgi:hypothetical protein